MGESSSSTESSARRGVVAVYFNRRMAALLGLGFAAGLPSAWVYLGSSLQSWLIEYDYDVTTVGLAPLIALPFAMNFAWAPLMDRFAINLLGMGRRRSWLLVIQTALVAAMALLALAGPDADGQPLTMLIYAGVLVAFLAASQDVVADAYRTDILPDAELGAGAAVFVNGYRVAMLLTGGGVLLLATRIGFRGAYLCMAGFMFVGLLVTCFAPDPPEHARPLTLRDAVVEPVHDFFRRFGWAGLAMLVFVVLFKLPDALAKAMTMPMLQDHAGFSKDQIAVVREWYGLAITLVGALAGGAAVARAGLRRALWIFLVLQAASNLALTVQAVVGDDLATLFVVVGVENFCAGMVTAGFIAFLMSLCNRAFSATQYALFTSLNYFAQTVGGAPTGFIVVETGYATFFALTVLAAAPAMLLLWLLGDRVEAARA